MLFYRNIFLENIKIRDKINKNNIVICYKRCSKNIKQTQISRFFIPHIKHTIMRLSTTLLLFIGALIFSGAGNVRSDASDHRYKDGDSVPLYANKVGPFHNPR